MSQNDFVIANQTAPAFRTDLNLALQALASASSGATAPATIYANMLWYHTTDNILKMRSEANDAWIDLGTLDQSLNTFTPAGLGLKANLASPPFTGVPTAPTATLGTDTTQLATMAALQAAVAASPPGLTFLATADAASDATIDFTAFDNALYDSYLFTFANLESVNDLVTLQCRTSSDGGSTYDSGASDYRVDGTASGSGVSFISVTGLGNNANEQGFSGDLRIFGAGLARFTRLTWFGGTTPANGTFTNVFQSAERASAADVDAIRFLISGGNIESGTITMYGMRNA
jgi:hypothetical protein